MKKFVIISGAFAVSVFILSSLFKLMHWQGATWLLIISMVSFALVFIPTLALYLLKRNNQ